MTSAFVNRFDSVKATDKNGKVYLFSYKDGTLCGNYVRRLTELEIEKNRLKAAWVAQKENRSRIVAGGKIVVAKIEQVRNGFLADFEDFHFGKKSCSDMRRLWYGHTGVGLLNTNIKTILLNEEGSEYWLQFGEFNPNLGLEICGK